jgi:lysylphosphatidylglycerol synthetase-like protein (DUF2156 family)
MWVKILLYTLSFTCIVPAFIGVKNYRSLSNDLKAMTLYMVFCFLTEIPTDYLAICRMNNLSILHIYTPIEFAFLAYAYSFHIDKVISKRTLLVLTIGFILFSFLNTIFIQPLHTFNSYARCVEILLVILLALCYVYSLIMNNEQRVLRTIPMFWINTAVLIYFTAGFFLYLVSNNTVGLSPQINRLIWLAHTILSMGYYFSIAKALWIQAKR